MSACEACAGYGRERLARQAGPVSGHDGVPKMHAWRFGGPCRKCQGRKASR